MAEETAKDDFDEAMADMTLDQVRVYARNWIETARQHLTNEMYWRGRCQQAEFYIEPDAVYWESFAPVTDD